MARKNRDSGGGGDSWLNTYADMVTLLLTFFAVLLSMSSVDQVKFNAFIRSFSNLPQEVIEEIISSNSEEDIGEITAVTAEMDDLYKMLTEYVSQNNQQDAIEISMVDNIMYIRFNSSLFFEPDQYVLRQVSLPVLKFIGDGLKNFEPHIKMVNVLGFTATVQNGTYWMLSGERAAVVADFFNADCGFDAEKLTVIGYGNRYPVATNDTEEGRKQNRRVELVIVGNNSPEDFNIADSLDKLYGEKSVDNLEDAFTETEISGEKPKELPPVIKDALESVETTGNVEQNVSPYEE